MGEDKKPPRGVDLGGGWGSALTQLAALTGLARRESHDTKETYDRSSQVGVPLWQAVGVAGCIALFLWSIVTSGQLLNSLLVDQPWPDQLLVSVAVVAIGLVSDFASRRLGWGLKISVLLGLFWHIGWSLSLLHLLRLYANLGDGEIWRSYATVPILVVAPFLGFRWLVEIHNPRYPPDPSLGMIERLIDMWTDSPEPEPEPEPEGPGFAVHRMRGKVTGITSKGGPPRKAATWTYELLDFVRIAKRIGIARDSAWVKKFSKRYKLESSDRLVTRSVYEGMIARLNEYGWIHNPSGSGWQWIEDMDAEKAEAVIMAEIEVIEKGNGG